MNDPAVKWFDSSRLSSVERLEFQGLPSADNTKTKGPQTCWRMRNTKLNETWMKMNDYI